jgi:hypothetical protein
VTKTVSKGGLGKYAMCETRAHQKKNVAGIHSLNGAVNGQQSYVGVGQVSNAAARAAVVGCGHASLLTISDAWHSKRVMGTTPPRVCASKLDLGSR